MRGRGERFLRASEQQTLGERDVLGHFGHRPAIRRGLPAPLRIGERLDGSAELFFGFFEKLEDSIAISLGIGGVGGAKNRGQRGPRQGRLEKRTPG